MVRGDADTIVRMQKGELVKRKILACSLFLVLAAGYPALAAKERASRPAVKADLVGTWDMVSVQPVHDKKDPVFYPYQRFVFNPDASMKFMVSDKPFTKDWLDKFKKQQA